MQNYPCVQGLLLFITMHVGIACKHCGVSCCEYSYENVRSFIRQDIEYILERIQEDLLKGFLIVPLRDDNGIWTAAIVNPRGNVTIDDTGCPQGSYRHTRGCSKFSWNTQVC